MTLWSRRDGRRGEQGAAVVEIVVVIPVVMVLLLLVVQFALWAHAAQVAQLAASEGDRVARSLGGSPASGQTTAQAIAAGAGSDLASSSVTADVMPGDVARVSVVGSAVTIFPWLSLPVSAVQVGPVQEFRVSG